MSQGLLVPRVLRRRRAGGSWLYLPGVSGNYASAPDSAALSVTGDIDVRVYAASTDWTGGDLQALVSKWNTSGNQRSFVVYVTTSGEIRIDTTTDGTALDTTTLTSSASLSLADGAIKWIRATLDVDNDSGGADAQFYTSDDGETWTELGTTQTNGSTLSIFDGTASLMVGAAVSGGASLFDGKVYRAQVYDGIDGTLVFDADFRDTALIGSSTFTEGSANAATVTINTSGGDPAEIVGAWR